LATSVLDHDQPLFDLAQLLAVKIFRGSESDVLDRYYQCALEYSLDHIVRATGDNPFVDPEECDRLIDFYFSRQLDYATVSVDPEKGFPLGVGVEIFSLSVLKKSWEHGRSAHHREHVNEYILENPEIFKQDKMAAPPKKAAPELSLTVDTIEEFELAEKVYSEYLRHHPSGFVSLVWVIDKLKKERRAIGE
jgi:spore coat polysaccharide biosynthesis protein SpsF